MAHAAASWADDRSAVLDTLEPLEGVAGRPALLSRLFWAIAYEATEQGAQRLDVSAAPPQLVDALRLPVEQDRHALTLPVPAEIDPRHR
ncbi:MAG TPA: hypothetical protein VFS29_03450 [Motilibacteraceae bacterium]|nr:hypothetical protein [Motilibacteraceae bacterium]